MLGKMKLRYIYRDDNYAILVCNKFLGIEFWDWVVYVSITFS